MFRPNDEGIQHERRERRLEQTTTTSNFNRNNFDDFGDNVSRNRTSDYPDMCVRSCSA